MHSYADRYTHDFFFERDYPDVTILDAIFSQLRPEPQEKAALQSRTRIPIEIFDKALEKLWVHRGAMLDFAENATRGQDDWRDSYIAHGEQKKAQIEQVIRFAASNHCRMSTLVRHFGDLADGQTACGMCDFCAPAECAAQRFRPATAAEREALIRVIHALRGGDSKSTGKLHGELFPRGEMTRDDFEDVLGAMARLGLVRLVEAVFEKDGKSIPYRKAVLTREARSLDAAAPIEFVMKDTAAPVPLRKGKKTSARKSATRKKRGTAPAPLPQGESEPVGNPRLEDALRNWRLAEAKRLGVPAFRILTDRALQAMATSRPVTAAELLAIPGIGIATVEKYGRQIYRILNAT